MGNKQVAWKPLPTLKAEIAAKLKLTGPAEDLQNSNKKGTRVRLRK